MLKVKAGDVEKLGLLYKRYSRRLYGFFYRMSGDGALSEDLVQNVFVRMLKYRYSYSEKGSFESWIFHVSRNVFKDDLRKNQRYHFQQDMTEWEGHLKEESNQEVFMQKTDELNMLHRALASLSVENRELLELTRFQKLKYEKVSEVLDISVSAVKVRVHRAMKALKENYEKLDGQT
ncbi:MAG: RNA polymerase sigma factor [Cyclobacteriaceae bacterium]